MLLGIAQVSLLAPVRKTAWALTQFFRNAPWLVLLFYAMFLLPFEFRIFGLTIAFPAWVKAIIGLALPVDGERLRDRARRHPDRSRRPVGIGRGAGLHPPRRRCG